MRISSSLLLTPSQLVSLINVSCLNGFLLPQRTAVTQTPFPWFTLWIGLFVTQRKHYRVICWLIYIYLGKHSCLQSLLSSRFDGDHLLKSLKVSISISGWQPQLPPLTTGHPSSSPFCSPQTISTQSQRWKWKKFGSKYTIKENVLYLLMLFIFIKLAHNINCEILVLACNSTLECIFGMIVWYDRSEWLP